MTDFALFEKGRSQNRPLTLHIPIHTLDRVSVYLQLHHCAVLTYKSSPTSDCPITQSGCPVSATYVCSSYTLQLKKTAGNGLPACYTLLVSLRGRRHLCLSVIIVGHNLTIPLPHISHSARHAIKECFLLRLSGLSTVTTILLSPSNQETVYIYSFRGGAWEESRKKIYSSCHSHKGGLRKRGEDHGPLPSMHFHTHRFSPSSPKIIFDLSTFGIPRFLRHRQEEWDVVASRDRETQ